MRSWLPDPRSSRGGRRRSAEGAGESASHRSDRRIAGPDGGGRVGGNPADSAFRDANQKAQGRYREATAACNALPSNERKECIRSAKADLQTAQRVAKAEHDAALRRH